VLGAIRRIRSSQNIPPRDSVPVAIRCDDSTAALLAPMKVLLESLATAEIVAIGPEVETVRDRCAAGDPQFRY
jgi:valyl-tRNA synthetase